MLQAGSLIGIGVSRIIPDVELRHISCGLELLVPVDITLAVCNCSVHCTCMVRAGQVIWGRSWPQRYLVRYPKHMETPLYTQKILGETRGAVTYDQGM
jgi:hypothetical protein